MRRVGQVRKRDANEKPITAALRAVGAHVTPVSGKGAPDVLVRFQGRLWAFEIKNPYGRDRMQASQVESAWPVIRSVAEALQAIGILQ